MYKFLPIALLQSALLALGQVLLKLGLMKMEPFAWSAAFWKSALVNWPFALSGACFLAASLLWMFIVKHFPLSMAYPMVSLSYVFGLLAAAYIFHEDVSANKWIGVFLIVLGCVIVSRP